MCLSTHGSHNASSLTLVLLILRVLGNLFPVTKLGSGQLHLCFTAEETESEKGVVAHGPMAVGSRA